MEQNPRTSLLSAQSGVALSTCQKIVKKRLNLHPYKMSLLQELKPADYPRRVAYCSWFLNNLNDNRTLDLSFFSNKAWSCKGVAMIFCWGGPDFKILQMYLVFNVFYFYSGVGQKDSGVGRAHLASPFTTPLWSCCKFIT
jgi:hypothetical protein